MSPNPAVLTWPRPVAGGAPVDLTFLQATATTSGTTTTHTFASQNLGTAVTDRTIIVAVSTQATVSALTVGGISATKDSEHAGGSSTRATIWRAVVPTGSTGSIVATTGSTIRCAIGVWRIGGAVTLVDTGTGPTTTLEVDVNAGDFVIAGRYGTTAATWTAVTERYDATAEGLYYSGADMTAASTGTLAPLASSGTYAICDAVYRPA